MLTLGEARALFDRRLRAWLANDVDAYLACWASDMVFSSPLHRELRGREAYAALLRKSGAATRPLRFDIRHLAVEGDVVLAEWTMAIERRADGKEIAWEGASACAIRDGVITWWREYWDPASFA
jgi:ketosteroid isomerase-like protein